MMIIDEDGRFRTRQLSGEYQVVENLPPLQLVIPVDNGIAVLTQDNRVIFIKTMFVTDTIRSVMTIDSNNPQMNELIINDKVIDIIRYGFGFAILLDNGNLHYCNIDYDRIQVHQLLNSNVAKVSSRESAYMFIIDNCGRCCGIEGKVNITEDIPGSIVSCRDGIFITDDGSSYIFDDDRSESVIDLASNIKYHMTPVNLNHKCKIIDGMRPSRYITWIATEDGIIHRYDTKTQSSTKLEHELLNYIRFKRFVGSDVFEKATFEDTNGNLYSIGIGDNLTRIDIGFRLYGYRESYSKAKRVVN